MKLPFLLAAIVAMTLGAGPMRADDMKGMNSKEETTKDLPMSSKPLGQTHHAVGTVKSMDMDKGSVTISHGPVKTLNWPAMTMTFGVKDKGLLNQLAIGTKVGVDFVEEGSNYTIVKVKRF